MNAPSTPPMTSAEAERLCHHLGERLGATVTLAREPVTMAGGYMNTLWRIELSGADAPWDGPLVVRRFRPDVRDDSHRAELQWHEFVWAEGYPTPRPLLLETDPGILGAPFMIMQWLPGATLMSWLDRPGARALRVPEVLARMMLRLHRVDTTGAPSATPVLDAAGALDELRSWCREIPDSTVDRLVGELEPLSPRSAAPPVVCHLDLNPYNVLVVGRDVTGVVDWTNCRLADRHLDVADVDVVFRTAPAEMPRAMAAVAGVGRAVISRQFVRTYGGVVDLDRRALDWFRAVAACRRRVLAVADEHSAIAGERRGFTSPEYISALGEYAERSLRRLHRRRP